MRVTAGGPASKEGWFGVDNSIKLLNNRGVRYNQPIIEKGVYMMLAQPVFAQDTIGVPQPTDVIKITDIGQLISAIVAILLIIAALLAFLFLVIGGIQWITAGGDKAGMESARNRITHAIVGLIIVGAAWAIMLLVQSFLGITILGGSLPIPQPF